MYPTVVQLSGIVALHHAPPCAGAEAMAQAPKSMAECDRLAEWKELGRTIQLFDLCSTGSTFIKILWLLKSIQKQVIKELLH